MHFFAKTIVSKYSRISTYVREVSLHTELLNIKSGVYRQLITKCRETFRQSKEDYDSLKKSLPSITISGVFNRIRKIEYLIGYTNLIVFDLDHIDSNEINVLKRQLFSDDYVCACWISPSGEGIKFIIKTLNRVCDHKYTFDSAKHYYETKVNRKIDSSGSDITRLCFISDDNDLLLKDDEPKPYIPDSSILYNQINGRLQTTDLNMNRVITTSQSAKITSLIERKKILYSTEEKNNPANKEKIIKIIRFLKKHNLSITSSYENWYRVAIAIANTFSFDIGEKFYLHLCELDKSNHNEIRSKRILEYCYLNKNTNNPITFGSIVHLAQQAGFNLKKT
ncbi:protein VirE super family [Candidatus Termititenax persephonae]|uniref:Protein VirE super family n=1 Tax=Candidatus Termititenax persephonae TaxID=2218525 RepID=A0A388TGT6_9BACT|nr:protein VirE super family [Candidatus Termititenax persephonae]